MRATNEAVETLSITPVLMTSAVDGGVFSNESPFSSLLIVVPVEVKVRFSSLPPKIVLYVKTRTTFAL
ncbi:hypothetical protein BHE74_00010933 [Ensete ventricosum]|uniref:Uncharacterized protein n=1 Tax=Ensete ventricosum TaxID=4639 RepID=A0A427AE51_ENSVE|nr:hypothetical protein B296_00016774 [Ensete ventricosum]RWW80720.1 hypothetical protein BHE74_00010933 [Ensete ventricosum]RZR77575.1 hypothetical protein BHM03_00002687 [Ensete ventricosum]